MTDNLILLTDSYKLSHAPQYPPGTTGTFSYFESRAGARFPETVFFGLQHFLRRYLAGPVIDRQKIEQAASIASVHLGRQDVFHRDGWEHILDRHLGNLPLRIRAVPEGTAVDTANVLMTVESTDPKCWWLPSYLETLLVQVWYPSTVATLAREVKRVLLDALVRTGGDPALADFMLHDFGFRGVSSVQSAGVGGLAHLTQFQGTDTLAAVTTGIEDYGSGVCGFSIPASEHSTMTCWGRDREEEAFRNLLAAYPQGTVACVSDSYDIEAACRLWGTALREEVLARSGRLVVRPDSGDPVESVLGCLRILGDPKHFGARANPEGYRLLPDPVRVIQGDGCDLETIRRILDAVREAGWAAENLAFGMGGGLLQKLHRDTQRFAFKCSARQDDCGWHDVWKEPKGDPGKASKRGRLKLVRDPGGWNTRRVEDPGEDQLQTVFENGRLLRVYSFEDVRRRAALAPALLSPA